MRVTCGFIIEFKAQWLICHATGGRHWDFPKGTGNENEPEIETAIRETLEETGFDVRPHLTNVVDFGRHPYVPKKDLHLWGITVPEIDLSKLICESMVIRPTHKFPEVDSFMLIDPCRRNDFLAGNMQKWVDEFVLNPRRLCSS